MNKNTNVCNNCGKIGHIFHQCKLPITSYGIITFRHTEKGIEYLMIRRKDSFGYIDFVRGKYSLNNIEQLLVTINEMSVEEKERILTLSFDELWREMWGEDNIANGQYKNEEIVSKRKFEQLKEGVYVNNGLVTLGDLVSLSTTSWRETEWEFPKGRRNQKEKDIDCALREFKEETGIPSSDLTVIDNVMPFEEVFIGSNHKAYKHKYYLAFLNDNRHINELNNYQPTEVSKLEWKSYENCMESIRPYNLEKKQIIININKVLQEYRFYS